MGPSYLLLGAVAAAVGHLPEGTVSGTGGPTSPLERWLWELKLPLANISTNLVGSKVNVADTVCTHFEIVGLSSKFEAPEKIIVHADSLGLKCFGDYNVHTPIIGKSKGVVEFAVHGELNLMLDVTKNFSTRPIIEIKPECSVKLSIDSLDFHGSGISWLIEFLAPALRLFLPLFLDGQLCNVADGIITTNLTEVLETIDEELVLPPSPPPPYIENLPPNALDIQHNPTIGPLLETINRLARDNLTQLLSGAPEHFAIDANLVVAPLTVLPGLDLSLYIHRVNVTGINTGRISSILEPNHKYYLNSGVGFDTLDITVDITLFVGNKTIDGELPFLEERSLISLSTRNVELGASVLTAINLLSLPEVNLFQLLQPECWQRLAYDFNISYVNVSMEVDSLSTKVNGTLESEMFQFLNGLVAVLLHTDAPYIPGAIDRAANLLLLPLLRSLLMPSSSAKCHLYPNQSTIDWEQVGLLGATEMINEKTLNTILRFAAPSGTFASNFSVSEQFSLLGIDIGLSLGNVMINGLNDTFYDTVLAKADSPSAVVTKLGIGQNSELQIRADLGMSLNSVPPIRTTLNETIWRGHMSLMETLVVSEGFLNLTIDSIIDPMHRGGPGQAAECFIADYVEKLNFTPFDFELGSMSTLLLWKGEWVSVKDVLYDLSPTLLSVLEELIKILPGDIESNINSGIQTALKDATYYCKGLQPPVENADTKKKFPDWAIALTVVGSTWLLMMIVGCWTWRRCKQKKLEKQKEPLIESKYSRPLFGRTASDMPDCALSEYYPMKSSFGVFIQLLIPSLILGGMAIKIWALIVWVTRVKLQVDMGDKEVLDTFIIDFTFQNMVEYFWKSEAYLISSLIVLGSSVVPLAMSLTMLACWFVPMNPSYRGRALLFFAQCGKGSYIDVMFLCYIILVIKQDISFHGITGVITAVPVQGIFGGIASTTCNLFTCIWMWHLHNNQMEAKTHPTETHRTEKRYNLWQLHTRRIGEEEAHSWRNSCKLVSVVILFLFAAVSLVTITFKSEVTWFKETGIAIEIPKSGQTRQIRTYNLYSMPSVLPQKTDTKAGAYTISTVYSILTLAVPLLLLLGWIVLWLIPLKKETQRNLYTTVYRLWCFSGLEVFWIASFAAVLEINQVCVWILNHTIEGWCDKFHIDEICTILNDVSMTDKVLHIDAKFLDGGWWLLAQCVLYALLHNATLYFGGMLLGHTSRKGNWTRPPTEQVLHLVSSTPDESTQSSPKPLEASGGTGPV